MVVKVDRSTYRATFRVKLPEARKILLPGDFNQWDAEANPMRKGRAGYWKREVPLADGDYEFHYLVDDREWQNDEEVKGVPNVCGSTNSLIHARFEPENGK